MNAAFQNAGHGFHSGSLAVGCIPACQRLRSTFASHDNLDQGRHVAFWSLMFVPDTSQIWQQMFNAAGPNSI